MRREGEKFSYWSSPSGCFLWRVFERLSLFAPWWQVHLQSLRETAGSVPIEFEDLPGIQALLESEESEWLLKFLENGGLLKLIKVRAARCLLLVPAPLVLL